MWECMIAHKLQLDNFHVEIIYERYDASNEKSFSDVLNRVVKELPDGVVLNPTFKSVALHFISILSANNIPYVFIDVNIKGVGKLGYFGQDAEQSGLVAGKLMDFNAPKNSEIVILKQAKNKIFSQHIESRIEGFLKYFEKKNTSHMYDFHTVEVDLSDCDEPSSTLSKLFAKGKKYSGIFVPNSRSFLVADYLEKHKIDQLFVIGYDLVDKNCEHLEKVNITCLLSQKPEDQAYNAIMALVDHLVYKKDVAQTNYSPIDIVIQENINYYKTRS